MVISNFKETAEEMVICEQNTKNILRARQLRFRVPQAANFLAVNAPGRLMGWASKATSIDASEFPTPLDLVDDEELTKRISQDVIDAIEESLNVNSLDTRENEAPAGISDHSIVNSGADTDYDFISQDKSGKSACHRIMERIWICNDQKASLFLQERLRQTVPGEFEEINMLVLQNFDILMIHRFGNFLVQCMLELAQLEEITLVADHMVGRMAELSKHQFCCHVIQRLLDVSPLVIQARIAAELLDDVIATMTSPFGTHVWQKLLHIPWPSTLPKITKLTNNAVHLALSDNGWVSVAETEAGCAVIKSFLGVGSLDGENQECIRELVDATPKLIMHPVSSSLIPRLVMITSCRARAMALIFSRAYEYCCDPVASVIIMVLLKMKIPSFPVRLSSAISPYFNDLLHNKYANPIVVSLEPQQNHRP